MTLPTRRMVMGGGLAALACTGLAGNPARAAALDKVLLVLNGTLGDKSFLDSAARGMDMIKAKYGAAVETRVLEVGDDATKWEPALLDAADGDWTLIIAGTFSMAETLGEVAKQYPDKRFILFDATLPYEKGGFGNVHSIQYRQNEGAYLGGVLTASLLRSGRLGADAGSHLGFLGAMDIPVIDDFLVGYVAGARSVDPAVKIATSYVGSFSDAAKGKELGLAQYRSGAALGFVAASQAGLGELAAAKEAGRWVLGVDSDQEAIFETSDPAIAARVVSSVLKNVDVSLLEAYGRFKEGKLEFGSRRTVGLAENGVGLVEGGNMARLATPEILATVRAARDGIVGGVTKVPTAFGMSGAELASLRDGVRP